MIYATDLKGSYSPQLYLWPADPEGRDFRFLVSSGSSVPVQVAPRLSESSPPVREYAELVVLMPKKASEVLVARSEELLDGLRAQYPEASFHLLRRRIDFPKIDRGRHLLARLGVRGRTASFRGWFPPSLFSPGEVAPVLLTVRRVGGEVSWVRLRGLMTPREFAVGSLEDVLPARWSGGSSFSPDDRRVLFLEPRDCPAAPYEQLVDACTANTLGCVFRAKTQLWSIDDAEISEEALAHLYPFDPEQFASSPIEAIVRFSQVPRTIYPNEN